MTSSLRESQLKTLRTDPKILILIGFTILTAYLVLTPLVFLIYGSFRTALLDPSAKYTIHHYLEAYLDPEFLKLCKNSLIFSIGVCILSITLGTFLAWIYERTNTPLKTIFPLISIIPLIVPGVLNAIAWIMLLSPDIGLINKFIMNLFRLQSAPFNIFSFAGMIWTTSVHITPLVFILMMGSFRSMDVSLEEAALTSGVGFGTIIHRITLPLMRPALISVSLLMFIRAFEAFETPALVGLPAGIHVFTTKVWLAIRQTPTNFGLAGALSVFVMFVCTIGVFLYQRLTVKSERFATITGKGFRPRLLDIGKWKYVASVVAIAYFIVSAVLPIGIILWSSFLPFYLYPSKYALSFLSLENYDYILLNDPIVYRAIINSTFLAIGAGILVMIITSIISWITVRTKIRGRWILDNMAFVSIAIPGTVVGVALLYMYLVVPIPIHGTIWILMVAYVTRFMPYGMRASSSTIIQIQKELEEAAATSGVSWFYAFRRILIPLMKPGLVGGFIYVCIIAIRELSSSIFLYASGTEVLAIVVFDLWDGGQYGRVNALGIVMISILVFLVITINKIGGRFGIRR